MIKNKIEGVKPFNKFWLKSCYYHQLIAGLSALGVDRELFLLNAMVFAKEGFSADEGGFLARGSLKGRRAIAANRAISLRER